MWLICFNVDIHILLNKGVILCSKLSKILLTQDTVGNLLCPPSSRLDQVMTSQPLFKENKNDNLSISMVELHILKRQNCYISLTKTFSTLPSMALANPTHTEIRMTAEADTNLTVLQAS